MQNSPVFVPFLKFVFYSNANTLSHVHTHTGTAFVIYGNNGTISGDSGWAVALAHINCTEFCETYRSEFW